MSLVYGSVCSGIEAASVAWRPLGWRAAFLSEIDAFPRAVLTHRWPEAPLHGDFTTIRAGEYDPVDVLVGGTPCQSFSVAGLRGGLADERGNLALGYLKLADRLRPRWLVWENVPGVLSSNGGRDFGAILGGMVELGYGFAYRVLDAQHFGVPQRRRRVFVVGHLGDWRRAAAVLFERHGLQGHPSPRREAGQGVAAFASNGLGEYGNGVGALRAKGADAGGGSETLIARSLNAHAGRYDGESDTLVAHSLRADGFDASEDGTGRGMPLVPVPFDTTQITSAANYSRPRPGDPCHPLASGAHPPAIAFTSKDHGSDAGDLAPTLRAMNFDRSHANAGGQIAVAFQTSQSGVRAGEAHATLDSNNGSRRYNGVISGSAVRRLIPEECEALQGFERGYTLIPWRKGMAPDGPRYKALGNSMAVPCMRWIGERIAAVDAIGVTPILQAAE